MIRTLSDRTLHAGVLGTSVTLLVLYAAFFWALLIREWYLAAVCGGVSLLATGFYLVLVTEVDRRRHH